jgi:hypothetical protein
MFGGFVSATSVHVLCLLCRLSASKSSVKCNGVIPHILVDKCCWVPNGLCESNIITESEESGLASKNM